MKTKKYFFTVLAFIAGIVSGISMIGLLAFTNSPAPPASGTGVAPITQADAHVFFNNYMAAASPLNQIIKGFTIDKTQLEAMNNIARENPDLSGFRIYMGQDNVSRKVGIVVGVDNMGRDAVKNTIYNTESQRLSPCPPVCDVSSPIILNN